MEGLLKIKKLEIVGFKSFVDKTTIHFDHDVIGVVGPNGCGKSNIVDAIRWCMGEQSAKHLRGRSMEDVIFNGSDSRLPHDFAEVTLTFENNDGEGAIEYRDFPEIAITRRLNRVGDSDYLINKTQVRLKDVTDLFLGTGAGTRAYSIVEQGKIGLIVSAKPEDRRMLVEEAAGITKFRSRRKQAEKKIELTQQNLLRVSDIIAEIERNIGSLKRQAAKAERYVGYRNELEECQLYEASHRFLELRGWIALERAAVDESTLAADEARSTLVAREAEFEALRIESHASEEQLERAQSDAFGAENAVRGEEAAIARLGDKLEALKKREEQAAIELREVGDQSGRLVDDQRRFTEQVSSLVEEDDRGRELAESEQERLDEVVAASAAADKQVNERRARAAGLQAEVAAAQAQLTGLERRQTELLARLERVRAEREELSDGQMTETARERELRQAVDELRSGKGVSVGERQRYETDLVRLRGELATGERQLDESKGELGKKRSRWQALVEMQGRLEGVGAGVKSLMATKSPILQGLLADRVEAPAEFTQALAALAGGRLQDVVVSDIEQGLELLTQMAAQKKGRATIVALPTAETAGEEKPGTFTGTGTFTGGEIEIDGVVGPLIDQLRFADADAPLVRSLVGAALVVADVATARRVVSQWTEGPCVTLGGTVVFPDGRIAGGQGEELAAGMLQSKREARTLADDVQTLDALVARHTLEVQQLKQLVADTQASLEKARHQAHADEISLVTAEKDLRQAQSDVETLRRRAEGIAADEEELSTALQEAAYERDEAKRRVADGKVEGDSLATDLRAAEVAAASRREELDARRQVVTEQRVLVASTAERLKNARASLARIDHEAGQLRERGEKLEAEIAQGVRVFDESSGSLTTHRERLSAAIDEAHRAVDALAAVRNVFDQHRATLADREARIKDVRVRSESLRDDLAKHELQLRERELAMQHLLESVAEKYRGLYLPRIVGDYHLRPPPDEALRGRIAELVQAIERIGSVNLDAMREYEEAEKRNIFYTTQKADLDQALADLLRAIAQMNKESKRLFRDTFEAIDKKFQEIFPRMFRGGQASLRLTNPDDLLETGIDILAQPPGKKLASIELMSGGEKALTAVSLIFAIFQVKPSPFCILDEVDAPLDEANVGRYNEAIRTMTDKSQFILITHVKRTMQLVDVLYGVTMPESGVSTIVSVKMGGAVERTDRKRLGGQAVA